MAYDKDAEKFEAWLDTMPGANHTLHVKGTIKVPTLGWTATFAERVPPGINPTILDLDLKKVKPSGEVGQQETTIEAHFKKPNSPDYKEVSIFEDGSKKITIPVKIVS